MGKYFISYMKRLKKKKGKNKTQQQQQGKKNKRIDRRAQSAWLIYSLSASLSFLLSILSFLFLVLIKHSIERTFYSLHFFSCSFRSKETFIPKRGKKI